jgi:DNA-binding transcriptional MerR regulator
VGTQAELMTVVEVRRRAGVTRKALRVYENLGLVRPVERTEAGYRLYDDEAIRRLGLIARAKSLGLTLAEAEQFLDVADACCGQDWPELAEMVERKLAATVARIDELTALRATLRGFLARLAEDEGSPRCDELLCTCQAPFQVGVKCRADAASA